MTPDMTTIATALLAELTPAQLAGAYSGRQGCCCGCRGKHYTTGASANDDRQTRRIWAAMQAAAAAGCKVDCLPGDHISVDAPNDRLLVAYLPGCFARSPAIVGTAAAAVSK